MITLLVSWFLENWIVLSLGQRNICCLTWFSSHLTSLTFCPLTLTWYISSKLGLTVKNVLGWAKCLGLCLHGNIYRRKISPQLWWWGPRCLSLYVFFCIWTIISWFYRAFTEKSLIVKTLQWFSKNRSKWQT